MDLDYESMVMERQEATEIWEDDPDSPYLNGWHPGEEEEQDDEL